MKHTTTLRHLAAGLLALVSLSAHGQGNITLGNRLSGSYAPVYDEDGETRLAGSEFLARFHAGLSPEALLPVGVAVPFRTGGLGAGYVSAQVASIPGAPNGTRIYVQMRAWAAASGDSHEEAVAAGGPAGVSNVVPVVVTEPPQLPAELMGLESFALRRGVPVRIIEEPLGRVVAVGAPVEFRVVATGDEPLTYQWLKDGAPLPGATEPLLSIAAAALADTGLYAVEVRNPLGFQQSSGAELVVMLPPAIVAPPVGGTVILGDAIELTVGATGEGISYQWYFNSQPIPGANQATLRLGGTTLAQAGGYAVEVRSPVGVVRSEEVEVWVHYALVVSAGAGGWVGVTPALPSYPPGSVVTLTPLPDDGHHFSQWSGDADGSTAPLVLTMTGNLAIEAGFIPVNGTIWFSNRGAGGDAPVYDEDGLTRLEGEDFVARLYGAETPDSLLPVGPLAHFGTGLSAGYLRSDRSLVRAVPPVPTGGLAYVQVRAWERAAGESYEEAVAAGGKAGKSTVLAIVTGGGGSPPAVPAELVGMESFALSRGVPAQIVTGPAGQEVILGSPASFSIEVAGTPPWEIQWFKDDVAIDGASSLELIFPSVSLEDAGHYHATVANPWGADTSNTATIEVLVPPSIVELELGPEVLYGQSLILNVDAAGTLPLTFEWHLGLSGDTSQPIGDNTPSLVLPNLTLPVRAWVRVSNVAGSVDSGTISPVITRHPQSISFAPLGDVTFGVGPIPIEASASSELPVLLAVEGPAVLEEGHLLVTGAGIVSVLATQPGDAQFSPAAPLLQTFTVAKAAAEVILAGLEQQYDGAPKSVLVQTVPGGLGYSATYDGVEEPPVEAGIYEVVVAVVDANYQGNATASMTVLAMLEGYAYLDLDGNGTKGDPELGLPDVRVQLFDAERETLLGEARTDEQGAYGFTGLPFGAYVVEETDPLGFISTTPNRRSTLVQDVSRARVDFGDQQVGTLSGMVFNDVNGNGLADPDEHGLPGVEVILSAAGVAPVTAQTDELGRYAFGDLGLNSYEVREVDPAGYTSTTANLRTVNVRASGATANFGDRLAGIISGTAFVDVSGNGAQDGAETGLAGVTIHLQGPPGTAQAVTDQSGRFAFAQLAPGTYTVREDLPAGYAGTTPLERVVTIADTTAGAADFGLQPLGRITGVVFNDSNANGVRESAEEGLAGVVLFIVSPDNQGHMVRTIADGSFAFEPSQIGVHGVWESDPAGFVSTTLNVQQVNVRGGAPAVANFGDQGVGRIAGAVFSDTNGNGLQDQGEPGIGGVPVRLTGETTSVTVRTSGDGAYSFAQVKTGTYQVQEFDAPGFTSTTPNSRLVVLTPGSSANASFGDQPVGTVSGRVFDDTNGNGQPDSGEVGLVGVEVRLTGSSGSVSSVTTGDGTFTFSDVTTGLYTVEEIDPPGYASTTLNSRAVNLPPGGAASVNFGDQPMQTIVGSVFEDQNGNGLQDGAEPGIADVEVVLLDAATAEVLMTTVTSAAGVFRFEDLLPGDYTVRQVVPEGYTLASNAPADPRAVALAASESDTVAEQSLTLEPNGAGSAAFPTLVIGSITGTVFEDGDGNGQFSNGEQGLSGVAVELRIAGSPEALFTASTTAGGGFVFPNLGAADYEIAQRALSGYHTPQPVQQVTITSSGAATVRFANHREGSIGGRVFHDENANGATDPGEPGLAQVTVSLKDALGATRTLRTSGDGTFVFGGLEPGDYTVGETDPALFTSTTPNERLIQLAPGSSGTVRFGDVALPPVAPVLRLTQSTPGMWTVHVTGEAGRIYVVEASRDLRAWNRIVRQKTSTGVFNLNETDDGGMWFYRARVE